MRRFVLFLVLIFSGTGQLFNAASGCPIAIAKATSKPDAPLRTALLKRDWDEVYALSSFAVLASMRSLGKRSRGLPLSDLRQKVYLALFLARNEVLRTCRYEAQVWAWILTTARNHLLHHIRTEKNYRRRINRLATTEVEPPPDILEVEGFAHPHAETFISWFYGRYDSWEISEKLDGRMSPLEVSELYVELAADYRKRVSGLRRIGYPEGAVPAQLAKNGKTDLDEMRRLQIIPESWFLESYYELNQRVERRIVWDIIREQEYRETVCEKLKIKSCDTNYYRFLREFAQRWGYPRLKRDELVVLPDAAIPYFTYRR